MVQDEKDNDFVPPSWIDKTFIETALRNGGEANSNVRDVSVRLALAPGENYVSLIYRVKAVLDNGDERSLIVKGLPPGTEMVIFAKKSGVFRRESDMLADVIPRMEGLLEEVAPHKYPPFAARCPLHGSDPEEFLVVEDLTPAGFRLADRKRGLGLRHCLLALRTLARFHAASHALLRRQPELEQRLDNSWRKPMHNMNEFMEGSVQSAADASNTWSGFEKYAGMLEKLKPLIMDICTELNDPRPGAFNVVAHGDFWVNNMMFKYENDEPVELRLVDLQISHVASPAVDILYFLSTSASEDVYENHRDLLLRQYHSTLEETLKLLGMEAPTREALDAALNAHGVMAVMGAVCVLPIALAQAVPDLNASIAGDQSGIAFMYGTEHIRRRLQAMLPEFHRKGWLKA